MGPGALAWRYEDVKGQLLQFLENFRKIYIDIAQGLNVSMLSEVANELGIADKKSEIIFLLKHLYDCFIQRDAELIELNPLVYTSE